MIITYKKHLEACDRMYIDRRYIRRENNEKLLAITDSISYKMIEEKLREKYTFVFKTLTTEEARKMINANTKQCIGAVGHYTFAKDLNRVLDVNYHIPYGRGRERVHLTLIVGDYVLILSRISNRPSTYDKRGRYTPLVDADELIYTLAKVVKAPEVEFSLGDVNEKVVC